MCVKVTACADDNADSLCHTDPDCHNHRSGRSQKEEPLPQFAISRKFLIVSSSPTLYDG